MHRGFFYLGGGWRAYHRRPLEVGGGAPAAEGHHEHDDVVEAAVLGDGAAVDEAEAGQGHPSANPAGTRGPAAWWLVVFRRPAAFSPRSPLQRWARVAGGT